MKILVISHTYPRWKNDWSANFIEALCLAYIKSGHEVMLFVPNTPKWRRKEENLGGVQEVRYNYCPIHKWQVFGYGAAMNNDLKPSIGQIFLLPLLIISGIFNLYQLLKKESSIDFIHSHWAVPNSIISIIGRSLIGTKIPVFTSFPGTDVTTLSKLGKFGKLLTKKIIAKSDYLSCNSNDLRDVMVNLGLAKNKIDLVIYAVDSEKVKFNQIVRDQIRNALGIKDNEKILLMVGRFVPKKGFSTALKAMKEITRKYSGIKMIVVGDGNLKSEYLEILRKDETIQYVNFIGTVPLNDLHNYYSACDIFIMPTHRLPADGLNVAIVEAMSCGRPIVATNIGGNELVVFDGENGFLCEEDNPIQLSEKILIILNDYNLAQKMGKKSRLLVEEKFNWNAIAKYYLEKYKNIIINK